MKYINVKVDDLFNDHCKALARSRQTNVAQMVRDLLRRELLDFHNGKEHALLKPPRK